MNEVYKITREELEDIADSIRDKTGKNNLMMVSEMPTEIASISGEGGGGGSTILNGTSDPANAIGANGDIYLKTNNSILESVTFQIPVTMQLDYYCNENSVIEFDCSLPSSTNTYDTPFGSRGLVDHFIAYNGGILRYSFSGATGNVGDISEYYNKRIKITLSRTYCKMEFEDSEVYNVSFDGGTSTATVKLGLFSLFTNNNGDDLTACCSNGTFYGMKIYENGILVRDYAPYFDGLVYCIINTLSGDIFYPLNGVLIGTSVPGDTYNIVNSFVKVNSEWQSLIGSDINDVNTSGGATTDYESLINKPSINSVTLIGNKTNEDLGIQTCIYDETTDEVYTIVDDIRVVLASNVKFPPLIPVMTSDNQPSGLIETGNYYGYGQYGRQNIWNAFDHSTNTYIHYNQERVSDGWISYTFDNAAYVFKIVAQFGNYTSSDSIPASLYVYDENDTEIFIKTYDITGYSAGTFGKFEFTVNRTITKFKFVFGYKALATNIYTYDIQAYGQELP